MKSFLCIPSVVVIAASLLRAAPPATGPTTMSVVNGPGNTEIIRDLEIARVGNNQPILVDIARPKNANALMPAVLCVHGGGWSGGTKSLRLDLAQHGYFVVAVAYRLAGPDLWPAQLTDSKLAVRWIRANAAKYNVNPNKIGAWGHSAGGHLVACLGTMDNVSTLDEGPIPGVSSAVQAVADYAGPTNLTTFFRQKPPVNLFGPNGTLEMMDKASPINFVSTKSPPFLIVHGDKDKAVPIQQAETMYEALKKAGVPVEYIVQKNGGHSLGALKTDEPCEPSAAQVRDMSLAFFDKYLKQ